MHLASSPSLRAPTVFTDEPRIIELAVAGEYAGIEYPAHDDACAKASTAIEQRLQRTLFEQGPAGQQNDVERRFVQCINGDFPLVDAKTDGADFAACA